MGALLMDQLSTSTRVQLSKMFGGLGNYVRSFFSATDSEINASPPVSPVPDDGSAIEGPPSARTRSRSRTPASGVGAGTPRSSPSLVNGAGHRDLPLDLAARIWSPGPYSRRSTRAPTPASFTFDGEYALPPSLTSRIWSRGSYTPISSRTLSFASPPRTPDPAPPTPLDPDDYLQGLRPRPTKRTRFLPLTPTDHHCPPARRVQKRRTPARPKAFRCPNCRCRITLTPAGHPSSVFVPPSPLALLPEEEEDEQEEDIRLTPSKRPRQRKSQIPYKRVRKVRGEGGNHWRIKDGPRRYKEA
ncbi:hypothetical protein KC345_g6885 [Hortaea werneckii]|nr:hypothetical protein KC345_g6885 [Hortaea werneckii]